MQLNQVPTMFVPDTPVVDTNAVTAPAETDLQPMFPEQFVPETVAEKGAEMWGTWAAIAGLLVFAWLMARPGR